MHFFSLCRFRLIIPAACLGLVAVVSGDPSVPPAWWSDGDPPVIDLNAAPDNHGMANIGQAKWMAAEALRALDATAPQIATQIRSDLNGTDSSNRIVDLSIPDPKTPEWVESQKAPLLLGQLKAMAKPFYTRLDTAAHSWLDHESTVAAEKGQLQANGTKDHSPAGASNFQPWTVTGDDDNNKSPATIGQLKAVFSLRFESLGLSLVDTDGDGMKDHDELYVYHTDPNSSDSDGDGVSDWDEVTVCSTDPLTNEDLDDDEIADDMEKYLAKQLLESNPDPEFWGSYYAGLLAGNLDPSHDYTGEGTTAVQLATTLADNRQVFKWDQPIFSQIRGRWVRTIATDTPASGSTPRHISGVFQKSAIFGNSLYYSTTWVNGDPAILLDQYLDDHFEGSEFTDFRSYDPHFLSSHTMTGSDGYGVLSSFDVTPNGSSTEYVGRSSQLEMRAIAKSPSHEPFSEDYYAVTMKDPDSSDGTGPVLDLEKFTLSIPNGKCFTPWKKFKAPMTPGQKTVIQIEKPYVLALSPQVTNEDGQTVPLSEYPSHGKKLTPFVEVNAAVDKIAHRELLVDFGPSLKGKKVRWSQEEVPGADPATIRGGWDQSPNHKDCFETSADYPNRCTFTRVSQAVGETTVGEDGCAAIRVNAPPIGFNKVRIMINVENTNPSKLIDMEVPGVVVIDPGHGGDPNGPQVGFSDPEHALCVFRSHGGSETSERIMTLEFANLLLNRLKFIRERDHSNIRIFMTRVSDVNLSLANRAHFARDNGADLFLSLHFNDIRPGSIQPKNWLGTTTRGSETRYDSKANINETEDKNFGKRVFEAVCGSVPGAVPRENKAQWLNVLHDSDLGNTGAYHPVRAALVETEFIDNLAVDHILNIDPNHEQVRKSIIDSVGDAIVTDLREFH